MAAERRASPDGRLASRRPRPFTSSARTPGRTAGRSKAMKDNEGWRNSGPLAVLLTAVLTILGIRTFTAESPTSSGEKSTLASGEHSAAEKASKQKGTVPRPEEDRFWHPLRTFGDARPRGELAREIAHLSRELTDID